MAPLSQEWEPPGNPARFATPCVAIDDRAGHLLRATEGSHNFRLILAGLERGDGTPHRPDMTVSENNDPAKPHAALASFAMHTRMSSGWERSARNPPPAGPTQVYVKTCRTRVQPPSRGRTGGGQPGASAADAARRRSRERGAAGAGGPPESLPGSQPEGGRVGLRLGDCSRIRRRRAGEGLS